MIDLFLRILVLHNYTKRVHCYVTEALKLIYLFDNEYFVFFICITNMVFESNLLYDSLVLAPNNSLFSLV